MSEEEQSSELASSKRGRGLKVQISIDQFEEFENEYVFVQRDLDDNNLEFSSEPWDDADGFVSGTFTRKYYVANPSRNYENLYIMEVEMDWESMEYVEEDHSYSWNNKIRQVAFYRPGGWMGVREYS